MERVIVKNIINSELFIEDLGIGINVKSSIDFSELFALYELKSSKSLEKEVKARNIILNNGVRDFTKIESKEFFEL